MPAAAARRSANGRAGARRDDASAAPDALEDPENAARLIALRLLDSQPRTRAELERALARRGVPGDAATAVLDRFSEVGLVDDEAYAQMLVRSQQAGRGLARRALARELRNKGIDPELAAETLDGIDDESERERARGLVAKKLRSMHGLGAEVQTRRLAGMLARKGYSSTTSFAVIREAIADAPEHQPD